MRTLVLASTSPYRRRLLEQLQLPFLTAAPRFEEELDQSVAPELLVKHLAAGKAQSLAERYPDALIIGADQIFVDARGRKHGKPGNFAAALKQLTAMAGRSHTFYTGLALLDSASGQLQVDFATFQVTLRSLTEEQIRCYLDRERPFDCAGSFRVEGLGIALMESMTGDDIHTLIGLPLIKLVQMLAEAGVDVLSPGHS
ncbi:MAG: septum formation protein Maf [Deltaproteobacteria bacterium]|nr:MAG: septum formation protein Maf [Deltaproteobacteria bacterium]